MTSDDEIDFGAATGAAAEAAVGGGADAIVVALKSAGIGCAGATVASVFVVSGDVGAASAAAGVAAIAGAEIGVVVAVAVGASHRP